MHRFYTEDARHQRSMMWDTVKWFTPILMAIHTGWFWMFINKFLVCQKLEITLCLFALTIGGFALACICLKLLKSFYGSNLKYITMFAKVEDELDFDTRKKAPEKRQAWRGDNYITYEKYAEDRCLFEKAKDYVEHTLTTGTMLRKMRYVFYLFIVCSISEVIATLLYLIM